MEGRGGWVWAWTIFVLGTMAVFAQNVDEDELRRRDLSGIVFRNYVGPVAVVNTVQEIRGIGFALAAGVQNRERFTFAGKYSIIRAYDPQQPGLSADILVLERDARVDHIDNLNLIVSGYLERTFNYRREDARLLANFVTRYNALFRGNMDFFRQNYAPVVVGYLSPENAGLSTYYAEWPGRSRIVIPLRSSLSAGPRGLIDADEVSRPEVTRSMPETPQALQERRDIVDLREREIRQEEQAIRQREEELRRREQERQAAQQGAQEELDRQQPQENRQVAAQQQRRETQQPAQADQQQQQQQASAQQQTNEDQERQRLEQARQELQRREENLRQEREDIEQRERQQAEAQRQEAQQQQQQAAAAQREPIEPVVFLAVEADPVFARLMILDARGLRRLVSSELNSIRGRRYVPVPEGFLVIAGREGGDAAVRLVVLDREQLQMIRTGNNDVHPDSDLVVQGQNVYAAVKDGNRYRLGLFNLTLELVRQSAVEIRPQTAIQLQGQRLLVQAPDGRALFLNPQTLEQQAEVRP